MPNISQADHQARRERILIAVQHSPNGISEIEVSNQVNIGQRTVNTYLHKLEDEGYLYKEGTYWFAENHQPIILRKFELSAEEALTLYLASRLLVKHSDRRNEIAKTVLMKLAHMLKSDAGIHESIESAAQELAHRPIEEHFQDNYRIIMRSALYRVPAQITYHPFRGSSFTTVIHPYLIEPSVIGFATYVIGYSQIVNDLRTYKLERIQHARLLSGQEFTIPPEFPGLDLLKNAWSIFHGDETIDVRLRFHPDVVRRVRETNWHPSEDKIEDGEHLILRLQVADTTDLKPWIRGWGPNCEVLEPRELREEMEGEARQIAELYGWYPHRNLPSNDNDDDLNLDVTFGDFYG